MHAVCVEGTARAVRGVTASQTAARPLISAAYATEAESPRAPATAQEKCWTNAGYAQEVLMCKEKRTHLASRIYDSMQIELHLGPCNNNDASLLVVLDAVICNHLSRSLFLSLSDT